MKFQHLLDPDPPTNDKNSHAVSVGQGRLRRQRQVARAVSVIACSLAVVLTLVLLLQPPRRPSRPVQARTRPTGSLSLSQRKTSPLSTYPTLHIPSPVLVGASDDGQGAQRS